MAKRTPEQLSKPIKEAVNAIVFDKSIGRPLLIEALEDAASDIEGVIDALKDDERRAQARG